jgi:hypothetical protein
MCPEISNAMTMQPLRTNNRTSDARHMREEFCGCGLDSTVKEVFTVGWMI